MFKNPDYYQAGRKYVLSGRMVRLQSIICD